MKLRNASMKQKRRTQSRRYFEKARGWWRMDVLRRDLRLKAPEMHEATAALTDAVASKAKAKVGEEAMPTMLDEPSARASNYMRAAPGGGGRGRGRGAAVAPRSARAAGEPARCRHVLKTPAGRARRPKPSRRINDRNPRSALLRQHRRGRGARRRSSRSSKI